ncbi:alpha-amylase/4-alpha-glucanotransferase domain-containing protein [Gracilinema caldarium]|uniref:4-alpha-glucanotransferase n=1 Tax=Gracilinema caldarium (strain ATCC 51460 / DSM 7334 / H1) TaxID=744872 RepID=F8F2N4_GRAC1|nr:alpha-amylase/4-alpha-glucanotransferase domain-containing protein [Gracilinema caldarium]AEJ19428.1 4-alpha-glucanotransferase [Gracilinema caldarium DSM 7334]
MNKVKVIILTHHHVPFGSSGEEFESYYTKRLKPLVTSLYKAPHFSILLHCSGVLLEWIEKHHPELFMLLEELINRKQIELLGGGYYEPVFPLLSVTDKIGQIELLTTYIRKHFGKRPRGCWLPGMFWEQNYASVLNTCGIDYAFVHYDQFLHTRNDESINHIFITEDQGKLSTLFPVKPIGSCDEAIAYLDKYKTIVKKGEREDQILSLLINLESVGPEDTYIDEVERGFDSLFAYISKESECFDLTLPIKYLKQDVKAVKTYLTGVNPRQSLVKYPEANDIYGKMIYVHTLVNQLRGDKARKKNAREELWKAQGIDMFYMDSSRGIQNRMLRKAVYKSLLEAERITREKGVFIPSILTFDFNLDGKPEYVIQGNEISCCISQKGASVFELDYFPVATNYTDTFRLQEEGGTRSYKRTSFVEYLCPAGSSLHEILSDSQNRNRFLGDEWFTEETVSRSQNSIGFSTDGIKTKPFGTIEVKKQYSLKKNVLTVNYILINRGIESERFTFLPQIEFSFAEFSTRAYQLFVLQGDIKKEHDLDVWEIRNADSVLFKDCVNDVLISIKSVMPFDTWQYQVFEPQSVYQSTCILPVKEVLLTPGEQWETSFQLVFEKL